MKFDVIHDSRFLFSGNTKVGSIRKGKTKTTITDAQVKGRIRPKNWIACSFDAADEKVFLMTSGRPATSSSDSIYFLDYDVALRFSADSIHISGNTVEFTGKKCVIEVFPDHYKKNFNPFFKRFNKKQFPNAPVGWLSWYCYFCDFDEKKTKLTTDFAAKHFKKFGFEYVLIETWENNSDKMPVKNYYNSTEWDRRKFPRGPEYITDMIHKKGLKAGLWIVVFGTGEKEFFEKNKEMYIVDEKGKPLDNWSGWYVLDITHPKAKKYIADMIKTSVNDWNFDYLKIDGLEFDQYTSRYFFDRPKVKRLLHDKTKTEPLRDIMELVRKTMGKKIFFMACRAEVSPKSKCPSVADGARIGSDVFWDGEDPSWESVILTARATLEAYHLHNIAWYNDPDVLSIRKPLSDAHAKIMCTIVAITGQVLFLSDILYELPMKRVKMLQQLMPICDTYPGHIAQNSELQPVWNLVIERPFEQWNVVGLFNWDEHKDTMLTVTCEELGIDVDREYLLYDFWEKKFLGEFSKEKTLKLKAQSCTLAAIREKKDHPQILSIDRHITQGGICIKELEWSEDKKTLGSVMDLPTGHTFIVTLYVPTGYKLKSTKGKAKLLKSKKNIVELEVKNGRWSAWF
jgi:glycosyl hydrolase family 31